MHIDIKGAGEPEGETCYIINQAQKDDRLKGEENKLKDKEA